MRNTLATFTLCLSLLPFTTARGDIKDDLAKYTSNLTSEDVDLRRAAAKALADLGPDAKPTTPHLIKAIGDRDKFVRRFAAQALGSIDADPKIAVPALVKAMDDEDKEVVEAAVRSLAKMGPAAVPALTTGLKSTNHQVKLLCVQGLGRIGAPAKSATSALTEVFNAPPVRVRGVDRVAAENQRMALRKAAAEALGNIGPDAKDALPALKAALEEQVRDREFRMMVNAAIRKIEAAAAR